MATGTIKNGFKYIDTGLFSFTVSNYSANVDIATNIGIDKSRIISIMPIDCSGYANYSITWVYYPATGKAFLYTSIASASMTTKFRVIYE